ncbi:MAG: hypothetical protein LQ340_004215 [Diploschistes diacapsis]|nr:MAG: hypothetical protein LQ340_004215 [Diploschistes diacapsis]
MAASSQKQKILPDRMDVLEIRTVTQMLSLFEHSNAALSFDTKEHLRTAISQTAAQRPVDVTLFHLSTAFVNLLVRGPEIVAASPGHPFKINVTYFSETVDTLSEYNLIDDLLITRNPYRAEIPPNTLRATQPTQGSPQNKHQTRITSQVLSDPPVMTDPEAVFSLTEWLLTKSNYIPNYNVVGGKERTHWKVAFPRHVELLGAMIRRVHASPNEEGKIEWYHMIQRYVAMASAFKIKARIERGKHAMKASTKKGPKQPSGRNLYAYLTSTPLQLGLRAQKDQMDLREQLLLPNTVRQVYCDIGILNRLDQRKYKMYDVDGKERLGIALRTSLINLTAEAERACVALNLFEATVMDSDDTIREAKATELKVAVASFLRAIENLDKLLDVCVIDSGSGMSFDFILEYLMWIERSQKLKSTIEQYPQWSLEPGLPKQSKSIGRSHGTRAAARPVATPSYAAPTRASRAQTRERTEPSSKGSRGSGSSSGSKRIAPVVSTTGGSGQDEEILGEEEAIDDEEDDTESIGDRSEQPQHWSRSARRWLDLVVLHWRSIRSICFPKKRGSDLVHQFLRNLKIHLIDLSSDEQDTQLMPFKDYLRKVPQYNAAVEPEQRLDEWLEAMGIRKAWEKTTKFTGTTHCETALLSLSVLRTKTKENLEYAGVLETENHAIDQDVIDKAGQVSKVLAVTKMCCPACAFFVDIVADESRQNQLAALSTRKRRVQYGRPFLEVIYAGRHDTWSAVTLPTFMPWSYFEPVLEHAKLRLAEWLNVILSDAPMDAKTKKHVKERSGETEAGTIGSPDRDRRPGGRGLSMDRKGKGVARHERQISDIPERDEEDEEGYISPTASKMTLPNRSRPA